MPSTRCTLASGQLADHALRRAAATAGGEQELPCLPPAPPQPRSRPQPRGQLEEMLRQWLRDHDQEIGRATTRVTRDSDTPCRVVMNQSRMDELAW